MQHFPNFWAYFVALANFSKFLIYFLGVLTVSGNVWKEMRRFSLRTLRDFGFGKQKSMNDTIQQELADLIAGLDHKISSSNNPNNKGYVLEMKQFFTISILNILWNMIAGFRFEHSDERLKELINLIDQVLKENAIGGSIAALYIAFPILTKIIPRITSQGRNRHKLTNGFHRFFRVRNMNINLTTLNRMHIFYAFNTMSSLFFRLSWNKDALKELIEKICETLLMYF